MNAKYHPKKWLPPINPPTTPQISEASMPLCHPLYALHIYITWGLLCKEANTLIPYNQYCPLDAREASKGDNSHEFNIEYVMKMIAKMSSDRLCVEHESIWHDMVQMHGKCIAIDSSLWSRLQNTSNGGISFTFKMISDVGRAVIISVYW